MTHSISFEVLPIPRTPGDEQDGYEYLAVEAALLIDGTRALRSSGYFFDLGTILAMRDTPDEDAYPFTCSCGVPGCVDIHQASHITVSETTVEWELPPHTAYMLDFREDLVPDDGPVRLVFDRVQYLDALDAVTLELEALALAAGREVDIWPGSTGPDSPSGKPIPVREQLAAYRQRALDAIAEQEWRVETWGELLQQDLVLTMPNGFVFWLPFDDLSCAAVGAQYWDLEEKHIQRIENEIVPKLRESLDAAINILKSIPWPELREYLFHDNRHPVDDRQHAYDNLTDWPEVSFSGRTDPRRC
jgi:hypothetical protein